VSDDRRQRKPDRSKVKSYNEDLPNPPSYFSMSNTTTFSNLYPPDSALDRIASLPRSTDAVDALDMLPPIGVKPYILSAIMCMRMSTPALARMLPMLDGTDSCMRPDPTIPGTQQPGSLTWTRANLDAIALFLGACTRLRAYIYLRPAVELALRELHVLDKHDRMHAKEPSSAAHKVLARYHRLLVCLTESAWRVRPQAGTVQTSSLLRRPVKDEVDRIVMHVLAELDGMGCSLATRKSTLSAFLGPFLSAQTLEPIMRHIAAHGVAIDETQWHRVASVAFECGKVAMGEQCLKRAAEPHVKQQKRKKDADGEEKSVPDELLLLGALGARTFNDALTTLMPLVMRPAGGVTTTKDTDTETNTASEDGASMPLDQDSSSHAEPPPPPPPPTPPSTAATPETATKADEQTREQSDSSPATAKPRKQILNLQDSQVRAWSILLKRAATDNAVSSDDLFRLAESIPDVAVGAATLTPVLHGMMERNDLERGLTIWRTAQKRYSHATRRVRQSLLDAPLLSVAGEVRGRAAAIENANPVNFAIKTVDYYGARPVGANVWGDPEFEPHPKVRQSVPLDTGVLNMLLRMCAQLSTPSVAFRLWRVAPERWGVSPDDVSLAYLLDSARAYARDNQDTMESRVQMMKDTFSFRTLSELVTGPRRLRNVLQKASPDETRALFDPPGYTWRAEYGPTQPIEVARGVFEDVLFGNWPDLKHVPSPVRHGGTISELATFVSPRRLASAPPAPRPSGSTYAYIVPGQRAWDAYIKLIAYHFPDDDLPLTLAYMRALGVVPAWSTMLVALKMIGEREGPRMRVATPKGTRLMRDEEAVRAYLEDWLQDTAKVPSEADVAEFRKTQEARRAAFVRQRILHHG